MTPMPSHPGIACAFRLPLLVFWSFLRSTVSAPRCHHCYLSSTASPRLMTHSSKPGLGSLRLRSARLRPPLCPSWSAGFSPPHCYQASSALPHQYPRESATLCPFLASGSPRRVGFLSPTARFSDRSGGLPWVRRTPSPDPVPLPVGLVLRIFGLALSRLLDLLPTTLSPVRCSLRTRVLPHASFRHPPSWSCPCLVGVVLPSGNGRPSCPRSSGTAACAACQAHVK